MIMEPIVGLIRRFVVEFFNGHNADICREIMEPDYTLRVGDTIISGRDEQYRPAVQSQFDQFPGLGMTVHGLITNGEQLALHFSEHGASGGVGGKVACWAGVALYRWNGVHFTSCAAQEDYAARRRQLRGAEADPIAEPASAPWDTAAVRSDPTAEAVVRLWLERGAGTATDGILRDDEHVGLAAPLVFAVEQTEVTELFSAGSEVAFQVKQLGRYVSGLAEGAGSDRVLALFSAGIVSVADGSVSSGRVIRDRAGLLRAVTAA